MPVMLSPLDRWFDNLTVFAGLAAKDTASTSHWRRRFAEPFSDFGSTIGNGVGVNVLHEFEPGIEKLLKKHTPKFLTAMEEHRVRAGQR